MVRQKEEFELKQAYVKELKYTKYLEQQREKIEIHRLEKLEEERKKRRAGTRQHSHDAAGKDL